MNRPEDIPPFGDLLNVAAGELFYSMGGVDRATQSIQLAIVAHDAVMMIRPLVFNLFAPVLNFLF